VAAAGREGRLLPLIAAERTIRSLLLLAAGVYLLSHTGANFGSIANHLARDRLCRDDDQLASPISLGSVVA
jgi:hypothetical protein